MDGEALNWSTSCADVVKAVSMMTLFAETGLMSEGVKATENDGRIWLGDEVYSAACRVGRLGSTMLILIALVDR